MYGYIGVGVICVVVGVVVVVRGYGGCVVGDVVDIVDVDVTGIGVGVGTDVVSGGTVLTCVIHVVVFDVSVVDACM